VSDPVAIAIAGIIGSAALGPLVSVWVDRVRHRREIEREVAREGRAVVGDAIDAVHDAEHALVRLSQAVVGDHSDIPRAYAAFNDAQDKQRAVSFRLSARFGRRDPLFTSFRAVMTAQQTASEPGRLLAFGDAPGAVNMLSMRPAVEQAYKLRDEFGDVATARLSADSESQTGRKRLGKGGGGGDG
jgi:hypothetical protein